LRYESDLTKAGWHVIVAINLDHDLFVMPRAHPAKVDAGFAESQSQIA
jgi:hypothetical protein